MLAGGVHESAKSSEQGRMKGEPRDLTAFVRSAPGRLHACTIAVSTTLKARLSRFINTTILKFIGFVILFLTYKIVLTEWLFPGSKEGYNWF